ncbi:hypothetical protein EBX93_15805, partial [bacterium]|nr:hypothetical protein [bacterium]
MNPITPNEEKMKILFNNLGDYISIAAKELNDSGAVQELAEAGTKAAAAATSGVIRVASDAMAAVPFVGAIIDAGKGLNDGAKALSGIANAANEAVNILNNVA